MCSVHSIAYKLSWSRLDQYLFSLHEFTLNQCRKNTICLYFCKLLEGKSHYIGLLLVPAEVFFCPPGKKVSISNVKIFRGKNQKNIKKNIRKKGKQIYFVEHLKVIKISKLHTKNP